MKNFDEAFALLVHNEGGYANNPADPGGETMYGITKRVAVANGYTGTMRNLPLELAKTIAKHSYWDSCLCDKFDPNLAFQVFDCAYNHGPHQAILFLQEAVGVPADGIIGPLTLAAVLALPWWKVAMRVLGLRAEFFTGLQSWASFGKGWTRRVAANLKTAGE